MSMPRAAEVAMMVVTEMYRTSIKWQGAACDQGHANGAIWRGDVTVIVRRQLVISFGTIAGQQATLTTDQ